MIKKSARDANAIWVFLIFANTIKVRAGGGGSLGGIVQVEVKALVCSRNCTWKFVRWFCQDARVEVKTFWRNEECHLLVFRAAAADCERSYHLHARMIAARLSSVICARAMVKCKRKRKL